MKRPQSYNDLEVYLAAKRLAVDIHAIAIQHLPKFEMYKEGSQLRRSSKSVAANIVEGFGRRRYKNEFIQFLTYAIASCDETKAHLELLHETGSLSNQIFEKTLSDYQELGAKLYNFRSAIIKNHRTP